MARQPRFDLPGIPQHIVQRGNNRLPCFLDDTDRACYRHLVREALLATGCKLHAYALMDNHVHLLATPPEVGATGRMMQQLGRRYVGQFNARHARTGTLWEGRYKACLVDSEQYLLRCSRYIDLNPVRAWKRGQVHFRQPRAPNSYSIASVVPTQGRHRCSDAVHMARQPRLDLPGIPQHIVQRGNNRLPCFLDDTDRACYRQLLREALLATGCKLHAYVLMDNHVHLLATPPEVGATGRLMQQLGRRYVGQFNARHTRTGTLWEGRYKACLVDSEEYFLRCSRYIDLNPVRARMTDDPAAFPWSSCAGLCGLREDLLLSVHPVQHALGAPLYRAMLAEAISDEDLAAIRLYLQQQRAYGRDDFRAMVEAKTQRFASVRPAHRPARSKNATG